MVTAISVLCLLESQHTSPRTRDMEHITCDTFAPTLCSQPLPQHRDDNDDRDLLWFRQLATGLTYAIPSAADGTPCLYSKCFRGGSSPRCRCEIDTHEGCHSHVTYIREIQLFPELLSQITRPLRPSFHTPLPQQS